MYCEKSHSLGEKVNVLFVEVGKWGEKVGRLMRVLGGSGEEGPCDHSVVRQVSQRAGEGHALGMSKQFGAKAILWLAGGSSVVELCNCAL